VTLSDLALKVTRGYEDPPRYVCRYGDPETSEPSVTLGLTMKLGANIITVCDLAKARLKQLLDLVDNAVQVCDQARTNQMNGMKPAEALTSNYAEILVRTSDGHRRSDCWPLTFRVPRLLNRCWQAADAADFFDDRNNHRLVAASRTEWRPAVGRACLVHDLRINSRYAAYPICRTGDLCHHGGNFSSQTHSVIR